MKILLYQGVSLISRAIRWQTRSPYSHVAVQLDDGSVVEAWAGSGVQRVSNPWEQHKPGTTVEAYSLSVALNSEQTRRIQEFLLEQQGKGYDYRNVLRFVSRRSPSNNETWFCSELAVTACLEGDVQLLRGEPAAFSPRDVAMSPVLVHEWTETR